MDDSQESTIIQFVTQIRCKHCGESLVFFGQNGLLAKIIGYAVVMQSIRDKIDDGEMEQACGRCLTKLVNAYQEVL